MFVLLEVLSSHPLATRFQTLALKFQSAQTPLLSGPSALAVSQGGEGGSGGRLSHGGSRRLPPCCSHPDEDLLGAGPPQETHLPQTERETGAGDQLTGSRPGIGVHTGG